MTAPVEVHLLQLPVELWSRVQQHTDELLRELALIAARKPDEQHAVPARLTELMSRLTARFDGVSSAQEDQLFAAAAAGRRTIDDLAFELPAELAEPAAAASAELGRMLDEADAYCAQGEHLLTLASPQEFVDFRWWYLDQFTDQVAGSAPTPWPDYVPRTR